MQHRRNFAVSHAAPKEDVMELTTAASKRNFARFAWLVLAYNLAVILWGAYVRASFSGDGCGAHWPTCAGQFLPTEMAKPKLIEFTHRMMTTLDSIATIALCVWAFLAFPKKHAVRRYSVYAVVFLLIEALLGAGLVLFRYVAHDLSAGRAWYLSLHLTNTMLLMGAYTITAWLADREQNGIRLWNVSVRLRIAVLATFVVSITGAIAALGDTLFPATSLAKGVAQDFALGSSLLLRLRLMHPAVAIFSAIYLLWAAFGAMQDRQEGSPLRTAGMRVAVIVFVQVMAGFANIYLLAPVWMQLLHLLIADVLWIAVVLLVCEEVQAVSAMGTRLEPAALRSVANQHAHRSAIR
jgi:cytochrome c oxidase assembly protein subunit 15